jgi:isoprenylcysteine carboxyl methyltransferase (ICMT) family protein YpbQ
LYISQNLRFSFVLGAGHHIFYTEIILEPTTNHLASQVEEAIIVSPQAVHIWIHDMFTGLWPLHIAISLQYHSNKLLNSNHEVS